ncbi:Lysophospholipase, alpha-beta hydrolase superfamily [Lutimaribacter pacificus]|uniref:Lysophospholipase, alpha-beta hydrolase superfamily n=1 Tax=Lutimaribacter pacificus TaxID=391948 RepID=A0A1H0AKA0_9RHOB|nr:alpha/beta fold hydrolase [Lutimaribacter pacificus]SDN33859.1 Lysophospholipase, alpha-beta hydrolase superfamily [Lutimaribacter pacificus]SHJ68120.1 Lysophospholipase, alpha-beta hydrolase superfamily [Lutimaribacter pacificus]
MLGKALIVVAVSCAVYLAIALGLILSQPPGPLPQGGALDFDRLVTGRAALPTDAPLRRGSVTTPDGYAHPVTYAGADDDAGKPLVILIHGSGWHGQQFDRLALALRDVAELRAVTLRGHGADPERRGDVDYIGQFEDDLAHVIGDPGNGKVVLLGHSSGGGLVVRFAGGPHGGMIDGAILLAPFLQYDAPVTRPNSGGWAHPLTRRIIGLSMLNAVGIHALDHLTVIRFAMPRAVLDGPLGDTATTAYSWRLNQSYAPRRDYLADVAALPPFLLVAGAEDESFVAEGYRPLMSGVTENGRYHVLPGAGHLDIVDDTRTETLIREFLGDL